MNEIINVDVTEILETVAVNISEIAENVVVEISEAKDAYQLAVAGGFVGSRDDWEASNKGTDGLPGVDGNDGQDGATGAAGSDANVTNETVNTAISTDTSASRDALELGASALSDQAVGTGDSVSFGRNLTLAGGLNDTDLRMSYSAATTQYSNSIENSFSGSPSGHSMRFNLTQAGTKTTPLKMAADGKIIFTGTPIFNGDVAINRGSTSPVASLEVGNTAISGGEAFAMSYAADANYRSGFITSVSGNTITSNIHTFFVKTGLFGSTSAKIWTALGNGNLGVGTLSPTANFQVAQPTQGIGRVSNSAGGTTVTGSQTQFKNTFKVGDTITISGQTVAISAIASDISMTTDSITNANTNASYTLVSGDRLSVLGNGNVGIGTNEPTAKLEVQGGIKASASGDVEITDTTKGIIMKSPNGTRYRTTVNDSGVLVTTAI